MDKYLNLALKEAKKAYEKNEVPVGCVIVKNGQLIAKAHNLKETKNNALAHAEILCIDKACKKLNNWRLEECEMYVTLYPCDMCLGAIKEARIKKVYFGTMDSKNTIIDTSICEHIGDELCSSILKDFFKEIRGEKRGK